MGRAVRSRPGGIPAFSSLLVFATSLALRLLYLVQIRSNPVFGHPTADARAYHDRALEILGGNWLGSAVPFHSSPLYPFFLAACYAINGRSIFWTYAIQAVIDAVMVVVLLHLADRLFGRAVAWITAVLAVTYQAFLFFAGEMLEITLVLAACVSAVLLLELTAGAVDPAEAGAARSTRRSRAGRGGEGSAPSPRAGPRPGRAALLMFGAGILVGLASLGKPNILATIPFLILGMKLRDRLSWSSLLRPALLLVAGTVLVVAPVTIRNLAVNHDFVVTTSNGGINFYIGNNPTAQGIFHVDPRMEGDLEAASTFLAERDAGRTLKPSQVSNYWFRRGLAFVLGSPGREAALVFRKLLLFWNACEIPNHYDINFFERYSSILRWTPSRFATVVPLALLGLALAWPARRRLAVVYLFVGSYLVTILGFFVTARYRLPVVPFLLPFAAFALLRLGQLVPRWREAILARYPDSPVLVRARPRPLAFLLLLPAVVLVHLPIYAPQQFYAHHYGTIGSVYKEMGKYAEAAEEYRKAIDLAPTGILFRNNLGVCLLALGKDAEGERMIRSALELDPDYAPALHNLGKIMDRRGEVDEALRLYGEGFDSDPTNERLASDYAILLAKSNRFADADRVLEKTLESHPENPELLWNLAVLLGTRMNQPERAKVYLDRLLRVQPDHPEARRLRAVLSGTG